MHQARTGSPGANPSSPLFQGHVYQPRQRPRRKGGSAGAPLLHFIHPLVLGGASQDPTLAGHREQAPPSWPLSSVPPPPKPLRSFSLLLSVWTLTLCPPTNGLCCQLFCSNCSRSKCAQREGLNFRSQMQVSKINGPLTLPPWATYPRAASVELCSVALSSS